MPVIVRILRDTRHYRFFEMEESNSTLVLKVNFPCCKACPVQVRKQLEKVEGVTQVDINVEEGLITVSGDIDATKIIKTIKKAGKKAIELKSNRGQKSGSNPSIRGSSSNVVADVHTQESSSNDAMVDNHAQESSSNDVVVDVHAQDPNYDHGAKGFVSAIRRLKRLLRVTTLFAQDWTQRTCTVTTHWIRGNTMNFPLYQTGLLKVERISDCCSLLSICFTLSTMWQISFSPLPTAEIVPKSYHVHSENNIKTNRLDPDSNPPDPNPMRVVHVKRINTAHCTAEEGSSSPTMATSLFRSIRRASFVLRFSYATSFSVSTRSVGGTQVSICPPFRYCIPLSRQGFWWGFRNLSHGTVNLVISVGKTKFETHEVEPPKKDKWKSKKRLKMQRKREKEKRKAANRKDPRRLGVKGKKKKQRFANAEERIKYKIENARIKEALLIERLKRYEVPKLQGPVGKPDGLTGEERFYLKKMAQKRSNYLQVGRRGLFGGVILNMHMHWKKHETVKVICKPCKPGQVHEYAKELARLSGGIPIQVIGNDTIIFYRGKNYEQPEVMSPIDTLSKKKALEKSKYEQSLESVRRFIAIAEKELELYYRHIALYGDPNDRNPLSTLDGPSGNSREKGNHGIHDEKKLDLSGHHFSADLSDSEEDSMLDSSDDQEREVYFTKMQDESVSSVTGSSSMSKHNHHYNNQYLLSKQIPITRD
ncbi:hypothetical protein VNO77_36228 [Canavalia gladiata]|uniref:CRM domain-containing protein n=1 Tax=Canavalia gladiata TaxID=3824 RepID=A0AAN9K7S4_CANGL